MRKIAPLVRKELLSYFNSPIAYILVILFLVFTSLWLFFFQNFAAQNVATLRGYFGIMPMVFIVLVPALTMRSWAEERKLGTSELLLTLPYSELEMVAAKFLGAFLLLALMLVLTLPVPFTVVPLGHFERGEILGEYLGILLLGAAALSVGQFVSSLSTNQVSAFVFGAAALVFFTLIDQVNSALDLPEGVAGFFRYLSLDEHFQSFRKGLLDTRDLGYFLLLTLVFQYLTVKVLVFRKWS